MSRATNLVFLTRNRCVSTTPIRALMARSPGGSPPHPGAERHPVRVGPRFLGTAAAHEGAVGADSLEPGDDVAQMRTIADHPRGKVRDGPESGRLELLTERDRRLQTSGRGRGHRDGGGWRAGRGPGPR